MFEFDGILLKPCLFQPCFHVASLCTPFGFAGCPQLPYSYLFGHFCETYDSLLGLSKRAPKQPPIFQRGVEHGRINSGSEDLIGGFRV